MKRQNPYAAAPAAHSPYLKRPKTQAQLINFNNSNRAYVRSYAGSLYPRKNTGQEKKFVDVPTNTVAIANTNGPIILNPVQAGTDYYQRIGNKIFPRTIHIKGFFQQIATSIQGLVRMVVVLDRAPSGAMALPAVTAILQERDQAGMATNGITAALNMDQRNRFKILRDKWFVMPAATLAAGVVTNPSNFDQEICMHFNEYIRLSEYGEMQFVGTANPITIANINTNAVYVIFTTQAGLNNQWQVVWSSRFKYTENK